MTEDREDREIVSMYNLLEALEAVIQSSDPKKREALAQTIDHYYEDFPEDFHWAIGASAPLLLANLMMAIDASCRPESATKPRPVIRLVDRKPEGSA
jgi:hypothetical protein